DDLARRSGRAGADDGGGRGGFGALLDDLDDRLVDDVGQEDVAVGDAAEVGLGRVERARHPEAREGPLQAERGAVDGEIGNRDVGGGGAQVGGGGRTGEKTADVRLDVGELARLGDDEAHRELTLVVTQVEDDLVGVGEVRELVVVLVHEGGRNLGA